MTIVMVSHSDVVSQPHKVPAQLAVAVERIALRVQNGDFVEQRSKRRFHVLNLVATKRKRLQPDVDVRLQVIDSE